MSDTRIDILCVGAGRVGSNFLKELSRFIATSTESISYNIFLYDEKTVDENDILSQPYILDDVGFSKAAVLCGVLKSNYPELKIHAYAERLEDPEIARGRVLNCREYVSNSTQILSIFFDFSNGDKAAHRALVGMFRQEKNALIVSPERKLISFGARFFGKTMQTSKQPKRVSYTPPQALMTSRICLAFFMNLLVEEKLELKPIFMSGDGYYCSDKLGEVVKGKEIRYKKASEPLLCVVVGTGGTGGNFTKEFVKYLVKDINISLLLIDGDKVEKKNRMRQPFGRTDIQQNKAKALRHGLEHDYPELTGRIFDYPYYLDCVEDLSSAIAITGHENDKILLIGGVDNHRARQVMEEFYHNNSSIVMVDSANEWSNGEVVVSVKKDNKEYSPLRSVYFPDVLTDKSPSASELSCGAVNESAPQHIVTNLSAAAGIMSCIHRLVENGKISGGILYFDSFTYFSRFQPVEEWEVFGYDRGAMAIG